MGRKPQWKNSSVLRDCCMRESRELNIGKGKNGKKGKK
jgi:hypothetical protein